MTQLYEIVRQTRIIHAGISGMQNRRFFSKLDIEVHGISDRRHVEEIDIIALLIT